MSKIRDTLVSKFSDLAIGGKVSKTGRRLGAGSFGAVEEITWNGTPCAAKRVHEIFLTLTSTLEEKVVMKIVLDECRVWAKLKHPHVVQFLGLYFEEGSSVPILVLEKMDTSLRQYLEDFQKEHFPLHQKVFVLRQVAQGLAYLHNLTPPLIHHDLSPNNILLHAGSHITKLTDFGMTRALDPHGKTRHSSIKGTLAFMAPEALSHPLKYDDKLDVFSYGNVIITTVTHGWPSPSPATEYKGDTLVAVTEYQRRMHHVTLFESDEKKLFLPLVQECLKNKPTERPSSIEVVEKMSQIEDSLNVQPDGAMDMTTTAIHKQLKETEKRLREKKTECGQLSKHIEDLVKQQDDTVKHRDEAIQQRDEAILKLKDAIQQRNDAIQKRDDAIKQCYESVEEKVDIQSKCYDLQEEIEGKDEQIASLENSLIRVGHQTGHQMEQIHRLEFERSRLEPIVNQEKRRRSKSTLVKSLREWKEVSACQTVIQHRPGSTYNAIAVREEVMAVTDDNYQVHLMKDDGVMIRSFGADHLSCKILGVTFNKEGNILVSDTGHKKVLVYSQEGQLLYAIKKGENSFKYPAGLAVSSCRYIYVCDRNQNLVSVHDELKEKDKFLLSFKGSNFGRFNHPTDIAISGGMYFVCDSGNERVCVCTQDGKFLTTFKTKYKPARIATTACGHLVITSTESHAVMVYTRVGRLVNEFGQLGDQPGCFNGPTGVAVDSKGKIYICDSGNGRIQIF